MSPPNECESVLVVNFSDSNNNNNNNNSNNNTGMDSQQHKTKPTTTTNQTALSLSASLSSLSSSSRDNKLVVGERKMPTALEVHSTEPRSHHEHLSAAVSSPSHNSAPTSTSSSSTTTKEATTTIGQKSADEPETTAETTSDDMSKVRNFPPAAAADQFCATRANYGSSSSFTAVTTVSPTTKTPKTRATRRGQLGAVRSLESNGSNANNNNATDCVNNKQQQSLLPSTSGSAQQQQKQMFSLKQLAINSRNLTKKRTSVQSGTSEQLAQVTTSPTSVEQLKQQQKSSGSAQQASNRGVAGVAFAYLFEPYSSQNNNNNNENSSSSNSSVDNNSCFAPTEGVIAQSTTRRTSVDNAQLDCQRHKHHADEHNESAPEGELSDEDEDDDNDDDEDNDDDDDDDDEDEDDDDEYDDDDDEDEEDDDGERNDTNYDKTTPSLATKKRDAKTLKAAKRRQRRRRRKRAFRRPSSCNCDLVVNKIDFDGLPVTDVDLVTYKDLCQMEQQTHHMRTNHRRHHLDALPYNHFQSTTMRRSSLQEESGAYYQLCTSGEEQVIRQKYIWFPPSLMQLSLVDQFFATFPKDKIPFAVHSSGGGSSGPAGKGQQSSSAAAVDAAVTTNEGGKAQQQQVAVNNSKTEQQHPAAASLASSYRDEQISFQLPRQDISLDYCSYPMSDASRAAYLQFIEKRNSQALDVGNVVQVKLHFSVNQASNPPATQHHHYKHSGSHTPATAGETQFQRQRNASTISQSAVALLALNQQSQHDQISQHVSSGGSQRCRRCLVRFEDKQLAVVAPNFVIGSALYRPSIIPPASSVDTCRPSATLSSSSSPSAAQTQQQATDKMSLKSEAPLVGGGTHAQPQLTNVALFHPNCFTCSTCKEFLVDLVYCLRDNKLYCLRHYGESLRPRCNWCQELIFSDEYLKAMNESFHVDHFLCRHCDSNLAGQRYVLKDEKPFCIQCYEGNFANICEDCQKPIGIDSRDLSYKERHWHDTCFLCNKCQQSLIDKPFGSKTDKVYCADCYDVTFATRCDGCKNPFRAGSKKMEYRGRQWHDSCFCCCICQNTIGSNSFIPKNDEIYCIKCYEDKYATRCTKCKQVIVSGGVTFRNEPWHRDCFNCCNCNKSLAGQRFTTRDVTNETVKNTNKTNQPHNAYCIDCYGELFAKRCYACSQAITGLGGTRFVTFEDRSWHNDCFICNDCNTSLVGKGFITDGPETILCGECARAKLR